MAAIAAERDAQIDAAGKDIHELAELFKDMDELVADSKPALEKVEAHVELAQERTVAGVEDLRKAKEIWTNTPCVIC